MIRTILGVGAALGLLATAALAGPEKVNLPADYKASFTQYYEGDRVGDNDKQVIRLFANEPAVRAARKDGKLPYGSVIVAEIYSVKLDGDDVVESVLGRRIADKLAAVVVMERGEGFDQEYGEDLKVGDWEFAVFNSAGKKLDKDVTGCRECHHPLVDTEFLWSYEHLVR